MSSVILSDMFIEGNLEVVGPIAVVNARADNDNDDDEGYEEVYFVDINALEDGEQVAMIQANAIDYLEVGEQAIAIQMDANDNEHKVAEEDFSQEVDFEQQQQQLGLRILFDKMDEEARQSELNRIEFDRRMNEERQKSFERLKAMEEGLKLQSDIWKKSMQQIDDKFRRSSDEARSASEKNRQYLRNLSDKMELNMTTLRSEFRSEIRTANQVVQDQIENTYNVLEQRITNMHDAMENMAGQLDALGPVLVNLETRLGAPDEAGNIPEVVQQFAEIVDEKIKASEDLVFTRMQNVVEEIWERVDTISNVVFPGHGGAPGVPRRTT